MRMSPNFLKPAYDICQELGLVGIRAIYLVLSQPGLLSYFNETWGLAAIPKVKEGQQKPRASHKRSGQISLHVVYLLQLVCLPFSNFIAGS